MMNEMKNADPERSRERLDWAVGFMCISFLFVYRVLGMLVRNEDGRMPTMGVRVSDGYCYLHYNPDFVVSMNDAELSWSLYHEILHIVLHHCTSRQFDNREVGNIAMDLAVDEIIPTISGSCEPPKYRNGELLPCFVNEFKKNPQFKDMENNQTAEYYYEYLMKKNPHRNGDGKNGKAGVGEGKGNRFDDHSGFKEDEVAGERVRATVRDIDAGSGWGTMSEGHREVIRSAQTRRINWRNLLRQFYGNVAWPSREATRKRPNRRTGVVHPGYRKTYFDRHLVAVDTSGSISPDMLAAFLDVINQLTEHVPIDLMQVDCEKQTDPAPFDRHRKEFTFLGRGGTDYGPVMKVVEERKYRSLLILTDGEAGKVEQPHADVVWVLPKGKNPPVDWGKRIHMDRYA